MADTAEPGGQHQHLSRLIRSGQIDEAQRLAQELTGQHPDDADAWYALAGIHAGRGRIKDVIYCCERVIALRPNHADAWYNLATALNLAEHPGEAETGFRRCLAIAPQRTSALLGIGKLLNSQGRHGEAQEYLDRASGADPANPDAFYCLGVARQSLGELAPAKQAYTRALQLKPDHFEATNNLGDILGAEGRFEEALNLFTRLVTLRPDAAEVHNNMGVMYESMGRMEEAETAYRKAIDLRPSLSNTKCHLGFLLATEGRTAEALNWFDNTLEFDPGYETAIAGQAVALEKLGRFGEAIAVIEPVVSAGSRNPDLVLAYCTLMLRKDDPGEGIRLAEQVLDDGGIQPKAIADLHFRLGDLYEKRGDFPAAFAHYEKANQASARTYDHAAQVRLVDGIIRSSGREALARLPAAAPSSPRMVFIIGMPRSGTSLVEQILASHPNVFGAGELRDIGNLATGFSPPGAPGYGYPENLGQLTQTDIDAMAGSYRRAVTSAADGSPVVTDKMPHNFLYLGLISRLVPDAHIIHVNRTPLDNCLSLYFHSFNPWHSYTTDLGLLGRYYRQYRRLMAHWKDVLNLPILDIRYEDVVDDLEGSARNMVGFCGLEWSDACLDFHASGRFVKTPSYDQVRRPIYRSSIGRWKHYRQFLDPLVDALGDDIQ